MLSPITINGLRLKAAGEAHQMSLASPSHPSRAARLGTPGVGLLRDHCNWPAAPSPPLRSGFCPFSAEFSPQPGLSYIPVTFDRSLRYVQHFGSLFHTQPAKESQLHYLALLRIDLCQFVQRFI